MKEYRCTVHVKPSVLTDECGQIKMPCCVQTPVVLHYRRCADSEETFRQYISLLVRTQYPCSTFTIYIK